MRFQVLATAVGIITLALGHAQPLDDAKQSVPDAGDIYIVMFEEAPLAMYRGDLPGLEATNPQILGEKRLNPLSDASRTYLEFLEEKHRTYLAAMKRAIAREPEVIFDYRAAGNGVAVRMTPDEAEKVVSVPGVIAVERDRLYRLMTDRGPWFINADAVWDGSVLPGAGTQGEGITVGIIDSGINQEHPSFSDTPLDGYTFSNPIGAGLHIGWCAPGNINYSPLYVCNEKLVGMYDYADAVSSDSDGPPGRQRPRKSRRKYRRR